MSCEKEVEDFPGQKVEMVGPPCVLWELQLSDPVNQNGYVGE